MAAEDEDEVDVPTGEGEDVADMDPLLVREKRINRTPREEQLILHVSDATNRVITQPTARIGYSNYRKLSRKGMMVLRKRMI